MKRSLVGVLAFGVGVLFLVSPASSQPPGGKGGEKGGQKGGAGMGGRFELGTLIPAFIKADLKLTAEQEKEITALEKDVKEKLDKLLTAEQKESLKNMRGPGGRGAGGPGGPGAPGGNKGGKGGGGEKKPPMPPPSQE